MTGVHELPPELSPPEADLRGRAGIDRVEAGPFEIANDQVDEYLTVTLAVGREGRSSHLNGLVHHESLLVAGA